MFVIRCSPYFLQSHFCNVLHVYYNCVALHAQHYFEHCISYLTALLIVLLFIHLFIYLFIEDYQTVMVFV